jgi:hypothetical protein
MRATLGLGLLVGALGSGCATDEGTADDGVADGPTSPVLDDTGISDDDGGGPTGGADDSPATGSGPGSTGVTSIDPDDGSDGPTADDGSTGAPALPPPTNADDLVAWLQAGEYRSWTAESVVHDSAGPHFGDVRTYVDDALLQSLGSGTPTHPVGAAAVKELYGNTGAVQGWSVIVKVADGAGGDTWYFLEYYEGTTYGDGVGDGVCTGCHGSGSVDFFKSPFPLQ